MANQRVDRRQILQGVGALGALGALAVLQSSTAARADDDEEEHERSLIGAWEFTATISGGVAATPTGSPMGSPMGTSTSTPVGTPTRTSTGTPMGTPTGISTSAPMATSTSAPTATSTATPMGTPTGIPMGTSLNRGLLLVAPGGVALITDQGAPSQQGGLGVGAWVRTDKHTFALTFVRQRFDATGTLVGTTIIRDTLTLNADGNTFSGSGSVGVLDLTGTVVSSGSFTLQGTRIAVQAVGLAAISTGTPMDTAMGRR